MGRMLLLLLQLDFTNYRFLFTVILGSPLRLPINHDQPTHATMQEMQKQLALLEAKKPTALASKCSLGLSLNQLNSTDPELLLATGIISQDGIIGYVHR